MESLHKAGEPLALDGRSWSNATIHLCLGFRAPDMILTVAQIFAQKNKPTLPNEANGCRQLHTEPPDSAWASG